MKNFDQFSLESQNAIKAFKENFWKILRSYDTIRFASNYLEAKKIIENDVYLAFESEVRRFLMWNGSTVQEFKNIYQFLKSKKFYIPNSY